MDFIGPYIYIYIYIIPPPNVQDTVTALLYSACIKQVVHTLHTWRPPPPPPPLVQTAGQYKNNMSE